VEFIMEAIEKGGWPMIVIGAIGFGTVALVLERFMTLSRLNVDKVDFNDKLFGMLLRGELRQAITFCDSRPVPLTQALKAGLVQVLNKRPDEEVQVALDGAVLKQTPRIEGWTGFLAVFGNVATLMGLLGTIIGLIKSFSAVSGAATESVEKAELLSKGISEALYCTAFGLIIAIPALVFFGYFQVRVGRIINDMVESTMHMMNLVVANRDKFKD
jgi:biopolymer transport protein ExbB